MISLSAPFSTGEQSADLDQYFLKCLRQAVEKLQSTGGIHEQYRGFHRSGQQTG